MTTKCETPLRILPAGTPDWISPELLADTIKTWQPYYREELTESEALEILLTVSRLIDALQNNCGD
ncbi:MAG: hypothetical protein LUE17_11405 [Planctomycetaceae bacterium]|nr:hypothetical protein [Planctomycetaceae bacterium]